jgi:hypothetical protein
MAVTRDEVSRDLAVDSAQSTTCPACAGCKDPGHSLCDPCTHRLPSTLRQGLCRGLQDDYVGALVDALNFLQADAFPRPAGDERTAMTPAMKAYLDKFVARQCAKRVAAATLRMNRRFNTQVPKSLRKYREAIAAEYDRLTERLDRDSRKLPFGVKRGK